ncbi:MAG: SLBB domain-containing protein [Balneolaceae bacterium]|nr:SLBB domain-containing protein [Balneolaceae bacterium]
MRFVNGMTLGDAIFRSGGFRESAAPYQIEVSRRIRDLNQEEVSTSIAEVFTFEVDPDLGLTGEEAQFELMPYDQVYVRELPNYEEQQEVRVVGQVRFPGKYTLSDKNERISDLIERAGGLTPEAYIEGASLFRQRNQTQQEAQMARQAQGTGLAAVAGNQGDGNGDGQMGGQGVSFSQKVQVGIDLQEVVR